MACWALWQVLACGDAGAAVLARGLAYDPLATVGGVAQPAACHCALGADGTATIVVLLDAPVGVALVRVSGAAPLRGVFLYLDDFPLGYAPAARHGVCSLALAPTGAWQASDLVGVGGSGSSPIALFNDAQRVG